ncbi:MAG: YceD family protein [Tabrizicola sp.]|jgi:uncharacterized metal-binding protein YceD (DUF177 family)|nr:YceD family protein [Tabrizicola sp.]
MSDPAPDRAPDLATARPTRFRTGGLSPRKPTRFSYRPDATERAGLAEDLGLLALHALDLTGEIRPVGRDELMLEATLTARADQACVVTLAPVPAVLTETVRRRYVAGLASPEGEEIEMPEDDSVEPMPETIDLADVAAEALALALPLYPRAPGAELGQAVHAGDGVAPLTDADLKPFAGLQDLAKQLAAKEKPGSGTGE